MNIEVVLGLVNVEAEMEAALGAWLARARHYTVTLAGLQVDSHGHLMQHFGSSFLHRGGLTIGMQTIVTVRELEEEQHSGHNPILEGVLGVASIRGLLTTI